MRIEDLDCFKDIPIDEIDENEFLKVNMDFDKSEVYSCQVLRF